MCHADQITLLLAAIQRLDHYEARWTDNIELNICSEGAPEDSFQHYCVGAGWMQDVVCVCG